MKLEFSMKLNISKKNPQILQHILDELIEIGALSSSNNVRSVDFTPPKAIGSDIAVWFDIENGVTNERSYSNTSMIAMARVNHQVCNVWLNYQAVFELFYEDFFSDPMSFGFFRLDDINEKIVIEHTSLNPVYPLNIATFRSSVIGNAVRNYLLTLGIDAEAHFWVEALSKQPQVLLAALKCLDIDSNRVISSKGKSDHELGFMYASTILAFKHSDLNNHTILSSMFPLAVDQLYVQTCNTIETFDWNDDHYRHNFSILKDYCLQGFNKTFDVCDIMIDKYDSETDSLTVDTFNSVSEIDYEIRNCWYMLEMLRDANYVLSIVPAVMISQPTPDTSLTSRVKQRLLREYKISPDLIEFHPYGRVGIQYQNGDFIYDRIQEGHYTSVDDYIHQNMTAFELETEDVVNAIKFSFLSVEKNLLDIQLSTDVVNENGYFKLCDSLEKAVKKIRNSISDENLLIDSEDVKVLLLNMLYYENVLSEQVNRLPEFGRLVQVIMRVVDFLDHIIGKTEYSDVLPSLLVCTVIMVVRMILNGLSAMGIVISRGRLGFVKNYVDSMVADI